MLKNLCLAALASLTAAQGLGSQVKDIIQYNEGSTVPFVFGAGPGQYFDGSQFGGAAQTDGTLTAPNNGQSSLFRFQQVDIQPKSTFVFQARAGFNATDVPEWGQADPRFGCLSIQLSNIIQNSYQWVLTNTQAYAYIANNDQDRSITGAWTIPLFTRDPSSIDLYTIVVDTAKYTVTYLVNNKSVLKLDGNFGIDPRFRYFYSEPAAIPAAKIGEKRSYAPIFSAANFPTSFLNVISMSRNLNFSTGAINYCVSEESYNNCIDNIAYVPHVTCNTTNTNIPETDIPGSLLFGIIEKFEMFYVEETDRCRGESGSSSSDFLPWWQRTPDKMIQEEENMELLA